MQNKKLKVGLYGKNGHQVDKLLLNHPLAEIYSVCKFPVDSIPSAHIKIFESLDEMLADTQLDIVSLCSPRRSEQAQDAIKCLKAGKHVYAEKPCAMTICELEEIIATAKTAGRAFHEMAGTTFSQPYLEMRRIVLSGKIGEVVQVFAQKSYPYRDWRPQDPQIDGGLFLQVGIHAARMIEHVAGTKIKKIFYSSTKLGNPVKDGGLDMAVSAQAELQNGGIATFICNYLNPPAFVKWGNEHLRIFGTKGFIESVDSGERTRLVLNDQDMGELKISPADEIDYFNCFLENILFGKPMPISLEEELHPLIGLLAATRIN